MIASMFSTSRPEYFDEISWQSLCILELYVEWDIHQEPFENVVLNAGLRPFAIEGCLLKGQSEDLSTYPLFGTSYAHLTYAK